MKKIIKPPLGIKPKWLHDEERHSEVVSAIKRRLKKGFDIPYEWIEEYNNFQEKNKKQLLQEENKVFNELDKEQAESIVSDILVDEIKKKLFEQMNDTGATIDTSCFDGLLSKMQDSKDFKRGDVLIREWLNGRVDYCRFKEYIKDNELLQNHFYDDGYFYSIYKNGKWNNFSDLENVAINCSYIETLKFNWRKATKEEIDKLNKLLGKEKPKEEERPKTTSTYEELGSQDFKKGGDEFEEEEKEVWWLCVKEYAGFTIGVKYKQRYYKEEILIDDDGDIRFLKNVKWYFNKVEENKELQEAKEILKDWRFGKCTYSSDEIDRAIETILKHLDK